MPIKINDKLMNYADFDPSKESKSESIKDLCTQIDSGEITLPIFQTYLRWQIEKAVSLFNFQLSGKAAVSPISMNRIHNKELAVPQITFLERRLVEGDEIYGKKSVNDGQQRLSTNYKAFTNHPDFRSIVLDLSKGKFVLNSQKLRTSQIPVGVLYNGDSTVLKAFMKKNKLMQDFDVTQLLQAVRTKHMKYSYIVNYANDLTETEQVEWFEVLNLAGSRVSEVQVSLTEMLVKGVDYYKEYSNIFFEKMTDYDLEDLYPQKPTEVSIPLAAMNPAYEVYLKKEHSSNLSPIASDRRAEKICKLEPKQIRALFGMTLNSVDKTLEFIEKKDLEKPSRLEYITYISGVYVYVGERNLTSHEEAILEEWYKTVEFVNKSNGAKRKIFDKLLKFEI